MNEIIKDVLSLIVVSALLWVGFYLFTRHDSLQQKASRYDCNLTEFVANVPNDIRDECRRQKLLTINNQKD